MINYGKRFEEKFKQDWQDSMEDSCIIRLYDNTSGYLSIGNVTDFICYKYPNIFFIECKTHKGASIPFDKIPQYDKMIKLAGIKGIRIGVILWLYEKDLVLYIPVKTLKKLKEQGEKSVGIRHLNDSYDIINIPSNKLRTFMKSDYSVLLNLPEGD